MAWVKPAHFPLCLCHVFLVQFKVRHVTTALALLGWKSADVFCTFLSKPQNHLSCAILIHVIQTYVICRDVLVWLRPDFFLRWRKCAKSEAFFIFVLVSSEGQDTLQNVNKHSELLPVISLRLCCDGLWVKVSEIETLENRAQKGHYSAAQRQ